MFEWVCQQLEDTTQLSRLEARGTIRLALREVGLTVKGVARRPMIFVLEQVLPGLLRSRNIEGAVQICDGLKTRLAVAELGSVAESPEDVFARMGGDSASKETR